MTLALCSYAVLLLIGVASHVVALTPSLGSALTWSISKRVEEHGKHLSKRDVNPGLLYAAHNFSVPIDHFHNDSLYEPHSNDTFNLRYWFDASHYKQGGPVIVLQAGETSADFRLPILQKGILAQLAQATNGIGVVLEHRYYGTSMPTPDLSTHNLRYLTTQQAMADQSYFARNIQFPGLEQYDLTSNATAYIGYGGSYAGAFVAFLRVIYPEVWWGVISSSGVTEAIYDYYDYFTTIAQHGPPACIAAQKTLIDIVDKIVIGKNSTELTNELKSVFQLKGLTNTGDFANILAQGITNWQSLNWDPAISNPQVFNYCNNISNTEVLYPATTSLRTNVSRLIEKSGYSCNDSLVNQMLNYIGYVNLTSVQPCVSSGVTLDYCYSNSNPASHEKDDLAQQGWRSWAYQYCSQWGYLMTGSGVPEDEMPLISRVIDLPYTSTVCREAFGIDHPANVSTINQYGGYDISYPRLAIVDGEADPWKLATPHAIGYGAKNRSSSMDEPFILIGGNAVHHWDENGVFPNQTTADLPPAPVAQTQKQEIGFVKKWMDDWKVYCSIVSGCT